MKGKHKIKNEINIDDVGQMRRIIRVYAHHKRERKKTTACTPFGPRLPFSRKSNLKIIWDNYQQICSKLGLRVTPPQWWFDSILSSLFDHIYIPFCESPPPPPQRGLVIYPKIRDINLTLLFGSAMQRISLPFYKHVVWSLWRNEPGGCFCCQQYHKWNKAEIFVTELSRLKTYN